MAQPVSRDPLERHRRQFEPGDRRRGCDADRGGRGRAIRLGLKPRAAVTHFALAGDDPILMLTAIIPATQKLLERAGLSIDRIDAFEVNEAFASVVLAWMRETGADPARVNR